MFAEGLGRINPVADQPEKPPSPWKEDLETLSRALADNDWRLVIDLLEAWPPLERLSEAEGALARETISSLCRAVADNKRQGKVFSSESLSDLEVPLEAALAAKRKEYNL